MTRTPVLAPPLEDVSAQLVTLLRGLKELHVAIVAAGAHPVEITAVSLLARVAELAPARLSSVACSMGLDLSTVSRQVAGLEREGWVVRSTDPDDRRAQLLELSPDGQSMLEDLRRSRAEVLAGLLPDWTEDELASFAGQLARFNRAITARRSTDGTHSTDSTTTTSAAPTPSTRQESA